MTRSVSRLAAWDTDLLAAAGIGLQAASRELAVLAGRVAARDLASASWSGVAADTAGRHAERVRRAVEEVANGLDRCGVVLRTAAEALRAARAQLARAASLAHEVGLAVADDGTVGVPPLAAGGELAAEVRTAAAALHADQVRRALVASAAARRALVAAAEADVAAARALEAAAVVARLLAPATCAWLASWAAGLTGPALRELFRGQLLPAALDRDPPPADTSPVDVAVWWASLTAPQQEVVVRAHAERLGALDGLPGAVRHQANVLTLATELAAARAALGARPSLRDTVGLITRLGTLESVARELAADPSRRRLLLLDLDEGRAAIAIGDVDTADHVAIVVPGLDQDVAEDMDTIVYNADRLARTADSWLQRLAPVETVATVAWLGYDTPSLATVASRKKAQVGAVALRSTLRGLDAARDASRVAAAGRVLHLTVVGHSYGTLAVGIALREPTGADEAVLVGSPGVGSKVAAELAVPVGHVFVGETSQDVVADLAWFGRDPGSAEFGAVRLPTGGGLDPVTGEPMASSRGHSQYFDLGSESVRNIALVAVGESRRVTAPAPQ